LALVSARSNVRTPDVHHHHSAADATFGFLPQRGVFCFSCLRCRRLCDLSHLRKAQRRSLLSPKGETICAVCCGTGREVTIDCPADCAHLLAAHRYEDEHPRSLPPGTPLLDVNLPSDIVHTQQQLMSALAFTVAKFCASQREATDSMCSG